MSSLRRSDLFHSNITSGPVKENTRSLTPTSDSSSKAGKRRMKSYPGGIRSKHRKLLKRKRNPKHSGEGPREEDADNNPAEAVLEETDNVEVLPSEEVLPNVAEDSRQTGALATSPVQDEEEAEPLLHRTRMFGFILFIISAKKTCYRDAYSSSRKRGVRKTPIHCRTKTLAMLQRRA